MPKQNSMSIWWRGSGWANNYPALLAKLDSLSPSSDNTMMEIIKSSVFAEWLSGLRDYTALAKITTRLDRVQNGNIGVCKSVGNGVTEMKIDYGPGYRIYFLRRGDELIILLAGGDKSTQKADIVKAKQISVLYK